MGSVGVGINVDGTQTVTVEMPHKDGWWIYAVFIVETGELKLAELRIVPGDGRADDEDAYSDGEWSGTAAALESVDGPLTARLLREVRLGDLMAEALEGMARLVPKLQNHGLEAHNLPKGAFRKAAEALGEDRRGWGGRADSDYLAVAVRYVELVKQSKSPVADLATELDLSAPQVRDLVHEARVRDLLTPGTRGRAGGALTAKAVAMLNKKKGAE